MRRRALLQAGAALLAASGLSACGGLGTRPDATAKVPAPGLPATPRPRARIGLALGGGAARGFAHVGVIKALETSGIQPDLVVGTSAGAVVGSLYAAGHGPFELQKLAIQLDESAVTDWSFFDRGFIKGEALERFINTQAGNKPIEGLRRRFAAVATDLQSGEVIVFQRGNTGIAVRASAAIPGVFPPVAVNGREYVDGGLVAPIPVREARSLGADLVIAVDISGRPSGKKNQGSVDVLLDTISIMGGALGKVELAAADVVIRPNLQGLPATSFQQRHEAILEGERAGFAAVPRIREALAAWERKAG
ncbi:MAG TPA: patatin-like phospholipase family protein [Rhodocyclaceae bacterium]|nr:patatin-like phospholipase family protein [Rhodocyclaceae bacterium]HNC80678.1 patatin-like phospholipase family protein [Rhodocyclaceae bacterium]HNE15642.1 patatin-like phospholipase family protein [Rhodocyclaceae bacterium]HNO88028.1 patatin-like phospholipase family protein [Rhodocyclaceae bacterium]